MDPPDPLLLVGAVVVGALLILLLFRRQGKAYGKHVEQLKPSAAKKKKLAHELLSVTREDVAKHNKRDDAWIIVTDRKTKEHLVYDITEYVDQHPGGDSILHNVGGDATEGVYGPQHPITVFQLLEDMLIGKLQS